MQITLWALAFIFLILYIREKTSRQSFVGVLLKSIVSLLFVISSVWASTQTAQSDTIFAFCIVIGLIFGMLGDIWLSLKYIYPDDTKRYTNAGFAMFAIGHIFYLSGLFHTFSDIERPIYFIIPLLTSIIIGISYCLLDKVFHLNFGRLKKVVMIYGSLLCMRVLISASFAWMTGFNSTKLNLYLAGSILFILSDIILSQSYFGGKKPKAIQHIANYATYYPAQFIFAGMLWFQ